MHRLRKLSWALRAVLFHPFFGSLGLPSYLGPTMFLLNTRRIFIGEHVRIFPGLRAECHGKGSIHIGDNVAIAQNFHITASGNLSVGAGTAILPFVMITDIDHDYADVGVPIRSQRDVYSLTAIGNNCFIGMGARILAGTILGDGCVVGANSVVRGEFPAHSVIAGIPGRIVRQYNRETGTWERP